MQLWPLSVGMLVVACAKRDATAAALALLVLAYALYKLPAPALDAGSPSSAPASSVPAGSDPSDPSSPDPSAPPSPKPLFQPRKGVGVQPPLQSTDARRRLMASLPLRQCLAPSDE